MHDHYTERDHPINDDPIAEQIYSDFEGYGDEETNYTENVGFDQDAIETFSNLWD